MNERGRSGYSPDEYKQQPLPRVPEGNPERLTSPGSNPYAKDGGLSSMASEDTKDQSQRREIPWEHDPFNPKRRMPIEGPPIIVTPNNPYPEYNGVTSGREDERMAQWLIDFQQANKRSPTPEELALFRRSVMADLKASFGTDSYTGQNELILPPAERLRQQEALRRQIADAEDSEWIVDPEDGRRLAPQGEIVRRERARQDEARPGVAPDGEDSEKTLVRAKLSESERATYQADLERFKQTRDIRLLIPEKFRKLDPWGDRRIYNVETLCVEIMEKENDEEFMPGGPFELLNEKGEFQPQNFLHWVRKWMMYWHSDSPDAKHDFGHEILLQTDNRQIPLAQMTKNSGRYFRSWRSTDEGASADFSVAQELVEQIKRETWLFGTSREWNIAYKENMGQDENLAKALTQMYYLNPFTKTVWNKRSSLYWIMNMPYKLTHAIEMGSEQDESHVGRALNTAYLTYYNMSDREKLIELLGEDAPLLDRVAVKRALKRQMVNEGVVLPSGRKLEKEKLKVTEKNTQEMVDEYIDSITDNDIKGYISGSDLYNLEDPNSDENKKKPKDKRPDLMAFINIFNAPQKESSRIADIVHSLIQESIAKKYDLFYERNGERVRDDTTVQYVDTFAQSMARWTGAGARNDINAVGFDSWSKLQNTEEYREKQTDPTRVGALGNPYTLRGFKQLATDFMMGTMAMNGKTPLQILEEMNAVDAANQQEYDNKNSQLVFGDNAMRSFTIDHLGRIYQTYAQIMNTEEVNLEKFTKYDFANGMRLERGPFEQALKEKFFKPMRYAWSTYAGLDLTKKVRAYDSKNKTYREMYLAEAMFGREILDIEPFRVKGRGHISIKADNWHEKINWELLRSRDHKYKLWRRAALYFIAAQIYMHRDHHSTDPRFNYWFYEQIIMALESIPLDIGGDEYNLQSSKAHGSNITKEEIKWLRKKASIESWRIAKNTFFLSLLGGFVEGLGDAAKGAVKNMKP